MPETAKKDIGFDPSTNRSANEYIDAANAVIEIAEIVIPLIPGVGPVANVAQKALKFAPGAKAVIKKLPNVAPAAQAAMNVFQEKAPDAINAGADAFAKGVKQAIDPLNSKIQEAGSAVQEAIDVKAQEKARKQARSALLDGAGIRMSAQQFQDNWSSQDKLGEQANGYLDYCGCYVIATYPGAVRKDDYGSFRDVYVGRSEHMGAAIQDDLAGRGNVDVYADVKFKQHVYVLLYPCNADKLDTLERSLITALDADASYNQPK